MIVAVVDRLILSCAGNVGIRVAPASERGAVRSRVPPDFCLPVQVDRSDQTDGGSSKSEADPNNRCQYGGEERSSSAGGC